MLLVFEITCRVAEKYTIHRSFKKHLTSYQKVFHANESAEYCLEHYVHGRKGRSVDLIKLFHISSHNLIFGLFYCRCWPPTTGRWHVMNNKWLKCVLFVVMPLSMSSNGFMKGARMSGVCAFIAGCFEYEHKTLLIHRPATLTFRT